MPRERSKEMAKVTIRYLEHSPEDRQRLLNELRDHLDANEGLETLIAEMNDFETQYGMSTTGFYARFVKGEMGDSRDFIKWAGAFRPYQHVLRTHFQHLPKPA
jgi:hypothetical protein